MAADRRQSDGRTRRARWRLVFLTALTALTAAAVLWGAYRHYTDPERIRALAQRHLQRYTLGHVDVGSAQYSWRDGVRLFDVSVTSPPRPGTEEGEAEPLTSRPLFTCSEVRLLHDRAAILFGDFSVDMVIALNPTCTIIRDRDSERTNLTGMLRLPESAGELSSLVLPIVELRNARIVVLSYEGGDERLVEDVTLNIRAVPSVSERNVYDVAWRGGHDSVANGHSQVDLDSGRLRNIRGGWPSMSVEAVMLAINARYDGAGAWCDLLGLRGRVRAKDYDLASGADSGAPRSVTIELQNASISIPINDAERGLPPQDRYLRFDRVFGEAHLTTEELRAEFDGKFQGSDCHVEFTLRGGVDALSTLEDVGFDVQFTVRNLRVPRPGPGSPAEQVRFIERWPSLTRLYRNYDPDGVVDIEFEATKQAGADQPIRFPRVLVTAKGGTASCSYFPYRCYDVTGRIELTPDGVLWARDLHGRHGDGEVVVNVWLDALTREAAKKVEISATGLAIDDALIDALPARYHVVRDLFRPRGKVDAEVTLDQPAVAAGVKPVWRSSTDLVLRDASMLYRDFPYPIDRINGHLSIDGERLVVRDLRGRAGVGRVGVDGEMVWRRNGGVSAVNVTIRGKQVAIDQSLLNALPDSLDSLVADFNPEGRIDVETVLTLDAETGRVRYEADVTLREATIRHTQIPVPITDVIGRLRLTPNGIAIEGLTGNYGAGRVRADGAVRRSDGGYEGSLLVETEDIRIDEALRDALPARIREVLGDWRIDGPISTRTALRLSGGGAEPMSAESTVRLSGVTVYHPTLTIPFEEVHGELHVADRDFRAVDVRGKYGAADVNVDLYARRDGEKSRAQIKLSALGAQLDEATRAILPPAAKDLWDRLRPSGTVDVHLERIEYRRDGSAAPRWSVDGYVELDDVSLRGDAPLEHLSGMVSGAGELIDETGATSLQGAVNLSSVYLFGHHLTQCEGRWSLVRDVDGAGVWTMPAISGHIYDGVLSARTEIAFHDGRVDYAVSTTVKDMQVAAFIAAERARSGSAEAPSEVRGEARVRIDLLGVVGDAAARRGRGGFEIVDGYFYRLPIILAILKVLNLSIPRDDAFDEARADFLIVGDEVQLEDIVLQSDALALVGSGTMSISGRAVDLNLVHVSSHLWAGVPWLEDFMENAARELVQLQVTGPLSSPTVRARPFRGITEELQRLFQRRKSKKNRSGKS